MRYRKAREGPWWGLAVLVVFAAGSANAQGAPSIATSKHNFQLQTNNVHVATGQAEDGLCVFCHTPHKGA
ncbi:MAG: hypothetical protein ACJ79C_10615, partial [Myxococcales bacterium]